MLIKLRKGLGNADSKVTRQMGIFSGGEKGKSLKASTVETSVHSRPWGDERIMSGEMVAGEDQGWYLRMDQR